MPIDSVNPCVRRELIRVARSRETITYGDLGRRCDVDPHMGLAWELGVVSQDCYQRGEPLLSALVINADRGFPGAGFFEQAQKYAGYSGDEDDIAQMRWWEQNTKAVWSYWANAPEEVEGK